MALTEREREVLIMVRQGLMNKEIAVHLGCSLRTVKGHMTHIMMKLGCSNRTEAAMRGGFALRNGE